MATHNLAVDSRDHSEETLDRAFDVLAHPYRRAIVEALERDAPLEVGELAELIADDATSARSVQIELAHRHLPRLDHADVVEYDTATNRCDLDRAERVRSILDVVQEVA